jgi:LuxR family maltose regulon positive regulatory protein
MTLSDSHSTSAVSARLLASLSATAPEGVAELLAEGKPVPAFLLAMEHGELAAASDVLRISWYDVLRDGPQYGGIRRILDGVPFAELRSHPLLALALGLAYNADGFRRAKAAQYFALATEGRSTSWEHASDGERVLICTGESAALRVVGQYGLSARAARAGLRALDDMGHDAGARVGFLSRIYTQLGISLYYGGEPAEAIDAFQKGYAEAGTSDEGSFGSLSMLAGVHALNGDLGEAATYVEVARGEPWTDTQRATYPGTFYRLAEAVLAVERGDVVAAQRHLDAMRHDRRSIEHWVAIARTEAIVTLVADDPGAALARLESFASLRATEERSVPNRQALASVRMLLHLALGNVDSAASILDRDAPPEPQTAVDAARLALFGGNPGAALQELRAIAGEPQTARSRAEAAVIGAAASLRIGSSRRRADAAIVQLGALLRETHQRVALMLIPGGDLDAIRSRASELGYGDLFTGQTIRSVLLEAEAPVDLTPRELEVLRALARGSSTAELAAELFVSVNTVKSQLRSVYRKLGVGSRDEAIAAAVQRHLLEPPGR